MKQGEKAAVLQTVPRKLMLACIRMFMFDFNQTWYDDRYYFVLHFDTSLINIDLHSRSQEYEKVETTASTTS